MNCLIIEKVMNVNKENIINKIKPGDRFNTPQKYLDNSFLKELNIILEVKNNKNKKNIKMKDYFNHIVEYAKNDFKVPKISSIKFLEFIKKNNLIEKIKGAV